MQSIWSAQQIRGSREYQEDYYAIIENNSIYYKGERIPLDGETFPTHQSLYLLADGMGGMGHGDVAAEHALEGFINTFLDICNEQGTIQDKFHTSLLAANQSIASLIDNHDDLRGMGCTFVAVMTDIKQETVNWISIGDSPLWLLRDGHLNRLNEIHTLNQLKDPKKFIEDNGLTTQQQQAMGHFLASALTGDQLEYIDNPEQALALKHADMLLLASDGLETLSARTISSIAAGYVDQIKEATTNKQLFELTSRVRTALIEEIGASGNADQDNTTVIATVLLNNELQANP